MAARPKCCARRSAAPSQGEQLVDLVDRLAVRGDRAGEAAGGEERGLLPSSSARRRLMPSTRPANPYTNPDWIAAWVCLPIAPCGAERSIRGSFAAREVRASNEISGPGPITPRYSPARRPRRSWWRCRSRPRRRLLRMRVGGDRVDQPVGAELMRVVDQDRHPGLQVRPTVGRAFPCAARRAPRTRGRVAGRRWRRLPVE